MFEDISMIPLMLARVLATVRARITGSDVAPAVGNEPDLETRRSTRRKFVSPRVNLTTIFFRDIIGLCNVGAMLGRA